MDQEENLKKKKVAVSLAIQGMEEAIHLLPEDASEEDERDFWIELRTFATNKLNEKNAMILRLKS